MANIESLALSRIESKSAEKCHPGMETRLIFHVFSTFVNLFEITSHD